jgi:hypothetical protein
LTLQGKGFYIWQILRCEGGDAGAIASTAASAGLTHVLIKIADNSSPYNIDPNSGKDLVPDVVQALRARKITIWGWQYVYGYDPQEEADIAIHRLKDLGLDGFAIDAEAQYKLPGREEAALIYMERLRSALPEFPIALSSYRYPTYHPQLPWTEFLQDCDINMPQVYWVESHNPAEQLTRCLREFEAIQPFCPIIPTGSAYLQGDWQATPADIVEFLDAAQSLNMTAANFWEWGHTRRYLPDLWDAIANYSWEAGPSQDIVERYFEALNAHNVDLILELYNPDAVHVTAKRTIQGHEKIGEWYTDLFLNILPNAAFQLGEESRQTGTRQFTWTATLPTGNVTNGNDSLGIIGNRITYHYSYFTTSD